MGGMWLRRQRGRRDRRSGPSPARAEALVAVYSRKGMLFIWAMNETDVLWQGSDAVWTLPDHSDADDIGDALQLWLEGRAPVVCPRTAIQRALFGWGRFLNRHRLLGPALTFLGVSAYWERAIHGVIILAAVAIDAIRPVAPAGRRVAA